MSAIVPGPNAASHACSSVALASAVGIDGRGAPSHTSVGVQRYWPEIHVPRGRARTIAPSVASRKTTRVVIPTSAAHRPEPKWSFTRSAGTSLLSCAPASSPCSCSAAIVSRIAARSHAAPSAVTPWSSSILMTRLRSAAAIVFVQAASITAACSGVLTNNVRRIPIMRTSERRSYRASSSCSCVMPGTRARAAR